MDHRAGKAVFRVRPGSGGRNEKGGVADAQGIAADHRCGVRIRGGHGGVPLAHRQESRKADVRRASRMEKVAMTANATKRWYVVHAYSGFEKSVQRTLLDRIQRAGMQEKFGKILVPTEEVVEMKGGQKNISERKFFPGYRSEEHTSELQSLRHLVCR